MKEPQSAGNTTSRDILSTEFAVSHKRGIAEKTLWIYFGFHCHAEYFCDAAVHPWIGNKAKTIQTPVFIKNDVFQKLPTSPEILLRDTVLHTPDIIPAQPDPLSGVRHPQPRGRTGPE